MPLLRWGVVAFIMGPSTWLLLGPIFAFHYHIGFGVLFYMGWNGEDPDPNRFQVEGYQVDIDPLRLIVTLVLWMALFAFVILFTRSIHRTARPKSR